MPQANIFAGDISPSNSVYCFLNQQGTLGWRTQFLWVFLLSKAQDP